MIYGSLIVDCFICALILIYDSLWFDPSGLGVKAKMVSSRQWFMTFLTGASPILKSESAVIYLGITKSWNSDINRANFCVQGYQKYSHKSKFSCKYFKKDQQLRSELQQIYFPYFGALRITFMVFQRLSICLILSFFNIILQNYNLLLQRRENQAKAWKCVVLKKIQSD